ncbi:hypothetical protein [Sphingobium fluviale]|uniref:Uncharacterized protein n=1 Tax=Sphingobium fluviale TaxID=2506423 RepID=A0A4Q1KH36_9SPHN|nr:hypothetical protein [Sphingobium fluviale]RXR28645.1 hypothetical protein EQG66_09775 [Sphingobium fluviale]
MTMYDRDNPQHLDHLSVNSANMLRASEEVRRVMEETGMGQMQAINHVRQRRALHQRMRNQGRFA